jgi:ribosomal RNA-processing protein 12
MDVDGVSIANPEASGVGAYVAALKGKDVAKRGRGGKLKFSNRKGGDDEDEEMDEEVVAAVKNKMSPGRDRGGARGRGGFRGRGGGSGARGGKSGKGGIAAGRRGLGVEKRHGLSGVGKGNRGRN